MADIRVKSSFIPTGKTEAKNWYINKARGSMGSSMVTFWCEFPGQDPWRGTVIDDTFVVSKLIELLDFSNNPAHTDAEVQAFGESIRTEIEPYAMAYVNGTKTATRTVFSRSAHGTRASAPTKSAPAKTTTPKAPKAATAAAPSAPLDTIWDLPDTIGLNDNSELFWVGMDAGVLSYWFNQYNLKRTKGLTPSDPDDQQTLHNLLFVALTGGDVRAESEKVLNAFKAKYADIGDIPLVAGTEPTADDFETPEDPAVKATRITLAKQFTNFMSGFHIVPSPRMANTVSHRLRESARRAKEYLVNYLKLIDNGYADALEQQMKSAEFGLWLDELAKIKPSAPINTRFSIYFGGPGTGKTTTGLQESEGRYIGCNSSMYPADLMEYYDVKDGKANFKKSVLWKCMEEGLPLTLDEINLLSLDCLRFLQTLLDGKEVVWYKGDFVKVHPNFRIIGTMNLEVNGVTYGLPEPLVDRTQEIREFMASPEMLGRFF